MKKIQLTEGMPTTIDKNSISDKTKSLLSEIKKNCAESGLSYVEINKALYLADTELYTELIHSTK
ncbi:hypothetical protein IGK74_002350 [Enterococcus sp. AZ150]|uniref:hypothetical protein n=1 Tax=Enterococcus sp. AZ150 TaxID=2774866 RepID=UPI003F21F834